MKLRTSHWSIIIGITILAVAFILQTNLPSNRLSRLKPIDSATAVELYNPAGNSVAGNPNGTVTLVEFFDYNCKYCRQFHPKLLALAAKNPNLRIVYKEFLMFGPFSLPAAQAALAAQKQGKYLALQAALLSATHPLTQEEILSIAKTTGLDSKKLQTDMASPAIAQQIEHNNALVKTLHLQGAPAFIVTSSDIVKQPSHTDNPQYFHIGSGEQTESVLQKLITKVDKG